MGTYDTRGGTPQSNPALEHEPVCDGCHEDPNDCSCRCCSCNVLAVETYDAGGVFDFLSMLCSDCAVITACEVCRGKGRVMNPNNGDREEPCPECK